MRRAVVLFSIAALLVCAAAIARGASRAPGRPGTSGPANDDSPSATRLQIVESEAARAASPEQLQLLVHAASSASRLQPLAIRALGRLEQTGLVDTLLPLLDASDTGARAAVPWALAQSAGGDAAASRRVRDALLQRLVGERDASVRGAIGEALGRLPLDTGGPGQAAAPAVLQVEKALVDIASRAEVVRRIDKQAAGGRIVGLTLSPTRTALVPMPALIGALRGLEALARAKGRARQTLLPETIERLRMLATDDPATSHAKNGGGSGATQAARARRLAILCLLPVGGVNAGLVTRALDDPDQQVRRLAVSAAAADRAAIDRALEDPARLVRYEALRVYGRRFQASEGCGPVLDAVGVETDHVSLLAVDLLGNPCHAEDRAVERLIDLAAGVVAQASSLRIADQWHRPAHAIVALAKAAPDRARPYVGRFLAAGPWQSRAYGATAAARAGDVAALRSLAGDANDNVRTAAVEGLSETVAHEADAVYIAALAADDFQLVMKAADALKGTPDKSAAVPALLSALSRLTTLDADPSRDPRVAILERLQELGSRENADALRPFLTDADPRVAGLAARVLAAWTGSSGVAAPRPRPLARPGLTDDGLQRLARTTVRITMASGGQFDVNPLVDLAPVSGARFVERAARGYYTGLTFHRVVPGFLIQGGSPGANEFMGDTRYMIDEPGRVSHTRGTVGSSTRGRDTGDGQFYVNLVDSPRLDHEYSIFGEVVRGMDVVDRILEGDVMRKVEVIVR
jgi:cyclophilin family peptidyl-prolyl cis-trans isomerase/HEAT repeat protein